jgi:hypothetical protein
MKGIVGCDADWLEPGQVVATPDGRRLTILRKVDLGAALEIAAKVGDASFKPVDGESFYEVDVDFTAGMVNN